MDRLQHYNQYYHPLFTLSPQDLRSVTLRPGPSLAPPHATATRSTAATLRTLVTQTTHSTHHASSSTDSIHHTEQLRNSLDNFNPLSSNLSSTEPSLLPSMPTDETASSSFGSFLIHFAFIVVLILVGLFVLIQCSHLVVYVARQAFKNRNSGMWKMHLAGILLEYQHYTIYFNILQGEENCQIL